MIESSEAEAVGEDREVAALRSANQQQEPEPTQPQPSTHVHKCVEPEDGGYRCASRGYCECECGAWSGTQDDDWFVVRSVAAK